MDKSRRYTQEVTRWLLMALRKFIINVLYICNNCFPILPFNSHAFGEKFSKQQWTKEIQGQREILHLYGGVKLEDVRGMRAPFLQIGGNRMFEMLYESNFTYDSSMPVFDNKPPFYPYTLDYTINHECMITPCPSKSYPGLWEVGKLTTVFNGIEIVIISPCLQAW